MARPKEKVLDHCAIYRTINNMESSEHGRGVIIKRPAQSRGQTELGWLHSRHTFSFGDYFDPGQMGFRSLRVINDDIVEAGQGFGSHEHQDVEIFSYVIEGELEHKDGLGNSSVIKAGNLQYISAGSGITHSEFNPSKTHSVHFLQIWLAPNREGGAPRYAEKNLGNAVPDNTLTLLFAKNPRAGAIKILQDAEIYFGKLSKGKSFPVRQELCRHAWLQIINGKIHVLDQTLTEGDGAAVSEASNFDIEAKEDSQFLYFDLE